MSQELVYTSAPKGLKPGTRGFCTVAMTQGMPPQLIERLESLSGYRQVFAPQDPQAAFNPVVQSHLRISVAGRSYHVLSRICAAGVDYSQRANKFAHHLVLDTGEMPAAGPAWALAQRGVMESAWDGATKILPAGRRCPAGNTNPAVCRAWQQATGDAGWGGILAETAIDKAKSIVTIIYRPGLDPLPLLAESLALLPPDVRRNVTFSTYYTKLPPGVECQWRCVLEGSPESKGTPGLAINLCRPLPAAQGGKFVAAARTGKLPQSTAPAPRLPTRAERPDDLELEHLLQPEDPPSPRRGGRPFVPAAAGDLALEALPPELPDDLTYSSRDSKQLPGRRPRLKQSARWPIVAAILTVVVILVGGGFSYWLANNNSVDIAQRSDKASTEIDKHRASPREIGSSTASSAPKTPSKNTNDNGRGSSSPTAPADANQRAPAASSSSTPTSSTPTAGPRRETSAPPVPRTDEKPTPSLAVAHPPVEVQAESRYQAALGKLEARIPVRLKAADDGRLIPFGPFDYSLARDCKLELLGRSGPVRADSACKLNPPEAIATGSKVRIAWTCVIDSKPQGEFTFSPSGLNFQWLIVERSISDIQRVNQLCNCVLRIALGKETKEIALRIPVRNDSDAALKLLSEDEKTITPRQGAKIEVKYPPLDFHPKIELLNVNGASNPVIAFCADKEHADELLIRDLKTLLIRAAMSGIAPHTQNKKSKDQQLYLPLILHASPDFDKDKSEVRVLIDASSRDKSGGVVRLTPFAISNDVLPKLNDKKNKLEKELKELPAEDKSKKSEDYNNNIDELNERIASARELKSLEENLLRHDSKAAVRYRIYMDVEGCQVDLVVPADGPRANHGM